MTFTAIKQIQNENHIESIGKHKNTIKNFDHIKLYANFHLFVTINEG